MSNNLVQSPNFQKGGAFGSLLPDSFTLCPFELVRGGMIKIRGDQGGYQKHISLEKKDT